MESPEPGVGVLLPVRWKPAFIHPQMAAPNGGCGSWSCPTNPPLTGTIPPLPAELDSVGWLWAHAPGGLDTEAGRVAWQQFAARHGSARAAWLARTFPPGRSYSGAMREEPLFSRIHGFPTRSGCGWHAAEPSHLCRRL